MIIKAIKSYVSVRLLVFFIQIMKRFCVLFGFILFVGIVSISQNSVERRLFYEFINSKNSNFNDQYHYAKRYFEQNNILTDTLIDVNNPKQLIRFEGNCPLYNHSHNLSEGIFIGINTFYISSSWHDDILGQHQLIGIWDIGHVFAEHIEFMEDNESRVLIEETNRFANHSTHVGGTIIAKGITQEAKGMAPEAKLYSSDYYNDVAEVALAVDEKNITLSNHSYGLTCGWSFNSNEDIWYWYGNTAINNDEDYKFGFYAEESASRDKLCSLLPYYCMVVSAGNDFLEGPDSQPVTHKIWEGKWKNSNVVRELDGGPDGYDCLSRNGVAKNVITVGGIMIEDDEVLEASYSSCGPTDDGRIKPDIVAPGTGIFSSLADSEDAYGYYSGTSMSAAFVTGGIALLDELHYQFQPGVNFLSSSIKGLLIHSAKNISGNLGPNYKSGWGLVDFDKAHQLLEDNILSGGEIITEYSIDVNETYTKIIKVKEGEPIKVTLVWIDLPGGASDIELNNSNPKLINDLDLSVKKDGITYYPFVLDPDFPSSHANYGVNVLDNVEQVIIENCEDGEYIISVDASKITSDSQSFSLIVSGPQYDYEEVLFPPTNLNGFYHRDGIKLFWDPSEKTKADAYEIYCNYDYVGVSTDTFFVDDSFEEYEDLNYEVRAIGNEDESVKSCFSNVLEMKALPLYQMPYLDDFEIENQDWEYLNTDMGWRYGNAAVFNSEYLNLAGNDSWFMGINSDNLGRGVHVWDYLISPPLFLTNSELLSLEFQYYLNNDLVGAHDSLSIFYRTMMNQDWILLKEMESVECWTVFSDSFNLIENDGVIQLAFLFDDNDEWGNGAGVDDFYIKESIPNSFENKSITYKCFYLNGIMYYENLNIESENAYWFVVNADGKRVSEGETYIGSGSTSFSLPNLNTGIYFIVLQTLKGNVVNKFINLKDY